MSVFLTLAAADVLHDISLHLSPGQSLALVGENGSGKTTLIKLLTRLYHPTKGRILLDGSDLSDWSTQALRERTGVIFQDFVRYQLQVGENLGVGDIHAFDDQQRWQQAARHGMADDFIAPNGTAATKPSLAVGLKMARNCLADSGKKLLSPALICAKMPIF